MAMVVVGLGIPNNNQNGRFFSVISAIVLSVGAVVWYATSRELGT